VTPSAARRRLNLPIGPLSSGGGWELDLTRLEDNRQALNERLHNHALGGKLRLSFRSPAREGSQLLSRSHPLVVELADFVAERALSGLEPELAARASVIRTKAVAKRTQVLVLRLRHQLHQSRWTGNQYEALPDLLVEECITARVNGCPASTPLAEWRQSSWPVRAGDRPQVVADDNLPATVAAATRKLSHPSARAIASTGFL
jgi:hypothetical protein